MALVNIQDEHHVVRHCKRTLTVRDGGKVVGVHPEFFHLRVHPEKGVEGYLSAVLYEFFCPQPDPMQSAGDAIPIKELRPGEALIRMNAGKIRATGKDEANPLRVVHDTANPAVPSKARLEGMPHPASVSLCSALAINSIVEIRTIAQPGMPES